MENKQLIVERIYNAKIERVWKAITDKDQMKEWYFDIKEFKPEKGFKFQFTGGDERVQYLHECEVLVVDPPNKLAYSWRYPAYAGYSVVTFELFKEDENKTRVRLTHDGLDSFPKDDSNFAITSFTAGWNYILGDSLSKYVETDNINLSVKIFASAERIWDVLLSPNGQWGNAFGEGVLVKADWTIGSEVIWTDATGEVGARGVVKEHDKRKFLHIDMYDDVDPSPGSATGEYAEKYRLVQGEDAAYIFAIEAGPLSKKHMETHTIMWHKGLEVIKELSERK
ncbi:MAG TPA: SRPBCC domain-containing protein [Ohtaekwangia sp.]|nr:SRPBCC domain-containing protein [Ohtaekwangia sp.]